MKDSVIVKKEEHHQEKEKVEDAIVETPGEKKEELSDEVKKLATD